MTQKCNVFPKIVVTTSSEPDGWNKVLEGLEENKSYIDIIEYRADLCGEQEADAYINDVKMLKEKFKDLPVLFTYRTKGQGGLGEKEPNDYFDLCKAVIESEIADIIDIEVLLYENLMTQLLTLAGEHQVKVLMSHHEFEHTPSTKELKAIYTTMDELGADYCKVAAMPEDGRDVLKLLMVVYEMNQTCDKHIVGIAMGELGKLTRLAGGSFGSALTYGHIGEEAAPGQLHVKQLKSLMEIYQ